MGNRRIDIINKDALEAFKSIPDSSIDLIVTDPPYNLKKDFGVSKDYLKFEDYITFTQQWLNESKRVLKDDGTMYIFMGVRFISYLYKELEDLDFNFNSWITWHYTQGIGKTKGFSPRHDDILMFTKSGKFKFNMDAIRIPQKYYRKRNNMRGANPGNVWTFSHVHYSHGNRTTHPTQKPEGLYERMILASSNENDTVLDPFSGSGTCARVCQQTNRKFIGFEISQEYVEMTKDRLNQPFDGFDSIDERMTRVPNDLSDRFIREDYVISHIDWFLNNHEKDIEKFIEAVLKKYSHKISDEEEALYRKIQKNYVNNRDEQPLFNDEQPSFNFE